MGSVRDDTLPHVSASASSLSLTHLDECSNNENQVLKINKYLEKNVIFSWIVDFHICFYI